MYLNREIAETMRFTRIQCWSLTATMAAGMLFSSCSAPTLGGGDFAPAPERESQASAPDDYGFVWKTEQFSFLPDVN